MGWVALLAEGVDRNYIIHSDKLLLRSPSSRRAWIEILSPCDGQITEGVALLAEGVDRNWPGRWLGSVSPVALLAEGVDRNRSITCDNGCEFASPSSRRAWIEIVSSSTL